MNFPNKEEAVRFFTDVESAILTHPEAFQDDVTDLIFVSNMLKDLDGDWRPIDTLEGLPDDLYEINKEGLIRNAKTQELLEVFYDIDRNVHHVWLLFEDKEWYIIGPYLAERMFGSKL